MIRDDEPEFDEKNGDSRNDKEDPPEKRNGRKYKGQFKRDVPVNGGLQITG
jgi:hypothetical protein